MKTYNTYQEAKIANPYKDISVAISGVFAASDYVSNIALSGCVQGWNKCNPADYCMTVEKFLTGGHKFVEGDCYLNSNGVSIGLVNTPWVNNKPSALDSKLFILRAAALEHQMNIDNLATQTPEEKEALDLIDTTPHQYEMSKFSGKAKWKNGDDVEAYGKPYKYVGLDPFNDNLCICLANQDDDPQCFSVDEIKKPETPQQREERERLEAAYNLYCHVQKSNNRPNCDIESLRRMEDESPLYTLVVDKTNYRKESN